MELQRILVDHENRYDIRLNRGEIFQTTNQIIPNFTIDQSHFVPMSLRQDGDALIPTLNAMSKDIFASILALEQQIKPILSTELSSLLLIQRFFVPTAFTKTEIYAIVLGLKATRCY